MWGANRQPNEVPRRLVLRKIFNEVEVLGHGNIFSSPGGLYCGHGAEASEPIRIFDLTITISFAQSDKSDRSTKIRVRTMESDEIY